MREVHKDIILILQFTAHISDKSPFQKKIAMDILPRLIQLFKFL